MSDLDTPARRWWFGLLLENGEEPRDPAYNRQHVPMLTLDNGAMANLEGFKFGPACRDWGVVAEIAVFKSGIGDATSTMYFHKSIGTQGPVYVKDSLEVKAFDVQIVSTWEEPEAPNLN